MQTDLGGGNFSIDIMFSSTADIYPGISGGDDSIRVNIGAFSNPLDLVFELHTTPEPATLAGIGSRQQCSKKVT